MENQRKAHLVDFKELPAQYPTHVHEPIFWETLGRTVATFGLLEEVLGKAIFAFTSTKPYSDEEIEKAYAEWFPKLEKALSDPLGGLIKAYKKALENHPESTLENPEELIEALRNCSIIRNVLCHGSWSRLPDSSGASIPFFINNKKKRFDTPVDAEYLKQTQLHTVELICAVVNSVTHMGWQFPGSSGPGESIIKKA